MFLKRKEKILVSFYQKIHNHQNLMLKKTKICDLSHLLRISCMRYVYFAELFFFLLASKNLPQEYLLLTNSVQCLSDKEIQKKKSWNKNIQLIRWNTWANDKLLFFLLYSETRLIGQFKRATLIKYMRQFVAFPRNEIESQHTHRHTPKTQKK